MKGKEELDQPSVPRKQLNAVLRKDPPKARDQRSKSSKLSRTGKRKAYQALQAKNVKEVPMAVMPVVTPLIRALSR